MGPQVPDSGEFQWLPVERRLDGKSFGDNDLQRFMSIHETPWN
jgi:hypothetical protein